MSRQGKIQKDVQQAVQTAPKRIRQKRTEKSIPAPFRKRMAVKISSINQFKGYKLGLISRACIYDDGIIVYLPGPGNIATYVCIDPNLEGDTIVTIEK